jgi:hypothetical protein
MTPRIRTVLIMTAACAWTFTFAKAETLQQEYAYMAGIFAIYNTHCHEIPAAAKKFALHASALGGGGTFVVIEMVGIDEARERAGNTQWCAKWTELISRASGWE